MLDTEGQGNHLWLPFSKHGRVFRMEVRFLMVHLIWSKTQGLSLSTGWTVLWSFYGCNAVGQVAFDTEVLHCRHDPHKQQQGVVTNPEWSNIQYINPKYIESQILRSKVVPNLYILICPLCQLEMYFFLAYFSRNAPPYSFLHQISIVWARSTTVNEWLNGEEAG